MAIINHDEKGFNAGLKVDIVSVALIKMAKKAGLNCTADVIELPEQFFSEEKFINHFEHKYGVTFEDFHISKGQKFFNEDIDKYRLSEVSK